MTLNLTKDETGTLLEMRNLNFWKALNVATEGSECDGYEIAANWYLGKEEAVIDADETFGIDDNDEEIPISEYPSHPNPLITRPRFDE